jgi:hypothetical protein
MRRLVLIAICGIALGGLLGRAATAMASGTIEGTVSPLSAAQEVEVCVVLEGKPSEVCATPGPKGVYSLQGLGPGPVKLAFTPTYRSRLLTQFFDHKENLSEATSIGVPLEGAVSGINADLVEGGVITGIASAADGDDLSEVEVCAVPLNSEPYAAGGHVRKSCDATDVGGAFELHSLPSGTYKVVFNPEGNSVGYQLWVHPTVSVTAGATTTNIDAFLVEGASIGGVIANATNGLPAAGISACLFGTAEAAPQRCVFSGESGEYAFQGLPDGSYQVGFSLETVGETFQGDDGLASQFYNGAATRSAAATISVLAPVAIEGINAILVASGGPSSLAPNSMPSAAAVVETPLAVEPSTRKRACRPPKHKRRVKGSIRCVEPRSPKHRSGGGRKAR